MSNLLDNHWGLINKSSLPPTIKQEMTCVIMNLRRDRDMGQYMELDHVLDQIVSVFSNDEDEPEELAAMLAADVSVVRNGYRTTPSTQKSSDTQGLMQFQDTLEKILKLVGDVKSELGLVRKSTSSEYTKNVEAPVQRRKQFGQRNNPSLGYPTLRATGLRVTRNATSRVDGPSRWRASMYPIGLADAPTRTSPRSD